MRTVHKSRLDLAIGVSRGKLKRGVREAFDFRAQFHSQFYRLPGLRKVRIFLLNDRTYRHCAGHSTVPRDYVNHAKDLLLKEESATEY